AVAGHVVKEDRIDIRRRACRDRRLGFGMDQMRDRPAGETREQFGEGFGLIRMPAREDEKVPAHGHAIFRIILPWLLPAKSRMKASKLFSILSSICSSAISLPCWSHAAISAPPSAKRGI